MNARCPTVWQCRDVRLRLGDRTYLMGIVNVTPDSFSDGGRYADPDKAVAHARQLMEEGADILDVGGESTRPGAAPVSAEEEAGRILPVLKALSGKGNVVLSVDTTKASVAEQALAAGAHLVNDVSALTADPHMAEVVRAFDAGAVLMHMKGEPRTMQANPEYEDVVAEVAAYLETRIQTLEAEGLRRETLAVDPGIGFGKSVRHNLLLLANLPRLNRMARPVVVGLSRKSFLGRITGREVQERVAASLGGMAYAIGRGAHVVRVHDVRESRDAARVADALILEEQLPCRG